RVLSFGMIEQTLQTTTEPSGETNALFSPKLLAALLITGAMTPMTLTIAGCRNSPPRQAGVTNSDGSITNPDGSVTYPAHTVPAPTPARNPDGSITNPDGSVTYPAGSNQASREGAPANAPSHAQPAYAQPTQALPPEAPRRVTIPSGASV